MLPTTIEALLIIALVALPGYIFTAITRRSIAYAWDSSDLRLVLTVLSTGAVLQAMVFLAGPLIQRIIVTVGGPRDEIVPWFGTASVLDHYFARTLHQHQVAVVTWAFIACVIVPLVLGPVWSRLLIWRKIDRLPKLFGLGYIDRTPTAWDYVVQERDGLWVVIHLKEARGTIAGVFGKDSFASLDPKRPDIYLQEAWLTDEHGNVSQQIKNSSGVWVAHDTIGHMYFLQGQEPADEAVKTHPATKPNEPTESPGNPNRKWWQWLRPWPADHHRGGHREARDAAPHRSQPAAPAGDPTSRAGEKQ